MLRLADRLHVMGLFAALVAAPAGAATLEGQDFQERVMVQGSELRLNGLGLRAVAIIKAYVVGLYLPAPAGTEQAVLDSPGAKRLEIRMLRHAGADDFTRALLSGLRRNTEPEEMPRLNERIARLEQAIQAIGSVRKGDRIALDFEPRRGLVLALNGQPQGEPIAGEDFYAAILRIFVGPRPVDRELKRALLG